jgi:hypothetical protein
MTEFKLSDASAEYLGRVEELVADIDNDDRSSLIDELTLRLLEVSDTDLESQLGTPESFVAAYRDSAGLDVPSSSTPVAVGKALSALALPLGVLVLFSFGGQLVLGPFVLMIEWVLARFSPRPVRIAWCLLAGALAGEIVYLFLGEINQSVSDPTRVASGLVVGSVVAWLYLRTTRSGRRSPASGARIRG